MKNMFAVRLADLIKENNISKRALAKMAGVSAMSVSDWTNGKAQPTAENIYNIASLFDVSADYLLGLEDEFGTKTRTDNANGANGNDVNDVRTKFSEDVSDVKAR